MRATDLYQRDRLWNGLASWLRLHAWLEVHGCDWLRVTPSQMRLLYREMRPCETVDGLLRKITEFEDALRRRSSAGRSPWLVEREGESVLARLRNLIGKATESALTGTSDRVRLGNERLRDEGGRASRRMQVARETLHRLLTYYKAKGAL